MWCEAVASGDFLSCVSHSLGWGAQAQHAYPRDIVARACKPCAPGWSIAVCLRSFVPVGRSETPAELTYLVLSRSPAVSCFMFLSDSTP